MERPISDMASTVNEVLTFVRGEAQRMEIGEVERQLISLVMEVGRAALQEFVAVKGTGYAGKGVSSMHRGTAARMFGTGVVPIGPSSEQSLSGEPTIMPLGHPGSFPWTETLTCPREAIHTWFRSSLPDWRSRLVMRMLKRFSVPSFP
jgi:hypothetical protein